MRRLSYSEIHRQAMLAAALVAAEVRDEAEDNMAKALMAGWYQAADKIARQLVELAEQRPSPRKTKQAPRSSAGGTGGRGQRPAVAERRASRRKAKYR